MGDVAHERGDHGQGENEHEVQSTGAGQRPGGEQDRHRGDRQADLLGQHPAEDDRVAVPDEHVDGAVDRNAPT